MTATTNSLPPGSPPTDTGLEAAGTRQEAAGVATTGEGHRARSRGGVLYAAIAMSLVGGLVAVSGTLEDAPLFTVQTVRYVLATGAILLALRVTGRAVPRPRGREWAWLAGVALSGLVLFNVAIVRGVEHAEPAVIGVAVAAVPVLLAFAGPLLSGMRPAPVVMAGAVVVTVGAVLVTGGGRTDAAGVGYALLTLACEAGFTLLAVPVLRSLGPHGVSLHTMWIAAAGFAALGLATEGPAAVLLLRPDHLLATAYLGLLVTVAGFLLWYTAVGRIGPGRAGLFTGVVPVASAVGGVLLGGPVPGPVVWLGIAVVATGVGIGMRAERT
ncbi:DMT family transporter [Myceligenerans indicum]|uniref:DMT family transporter n=1 Tax=Myceligenerans indicum TaxID=2593663 RepID=A0ABS1LLL4_9MICO|nr:DMT family transporter [Myceligenerans indicum]MBL0887131.1 DMT family transporter [Myceligenerans indicum]